MSGARPLSARALRERAAPAVCTRTASKLNPATPRTAQVLVLAVPPALPAGPGRPHADPLLLARLAGVVDAFSVMT
jgi:hypothetical protein